MNDNNIISSVFNKNDNTNKDMTGLVLAYILY